MPSPETQPLNPEVLLPRLYRLFAEVARKAEKAEVHRLRTSIRRCEELLRQRLPNRHAKLMKRLARLRRRAGRVRDLDVQIGLLRGLRAGGEGEGRRRLLDCMEEQRRKEAQRLRAGLDGKRRKKAKEGLRAAGLEMQAAGERPAARRVVAEVTRQFARMQGEFPVLSPDNLHRFRIGCKRLRYLAETGLPDAAAARLAAELKRPQDAIGDWHDWSELTGLAEAEVQEEADGGLLPALRAVTETRLIEGLEVALRTRELLLAAPMGKKPPQGAPLAGPAGLAARRTV